MITREDITITPAPGGGALLRYHYDDHLNAIVQRYRGKWDRQARAYQVNDPDAVLADLHAELDRRQARQEAVERATWAKRLLSSLLSQLTVSHRNWSALADVPRVGTVVVKAIDQGLGVCGREWVLTDAGLLEYSWCGPVSEYDLSRGVLDADTAAMAREAIEALAAFEATARQIHADQRAR